MSKITLEDERLMEEVMRDNIAFTLLKNKCRWEAMGRFAVLKEWGDPREWDVYRMIKNA